MQRRGGGGTATTTTAMSAIAITEESSASSDSSIDSNNNNHNHNNLQEEEGRLCNTNNNNNGDDDNDVDDDDNEETRNKLILIHTYNCTTVKDVGNDTDTITTTTLMGLGIPKRQFATWVQYYHHFNSNDTSSSSLSTTAATAAAEIDEIISNTSTQQVHWENDWETHITSLRQYWKDGKLLCEHTNLLNDRGGMIMSRIKKKKKKKQHQQEKEGDKIKMNGSDTTEKEEMDNNDEEEEEEQQMKYEQFRNIVGSYANRLVSIVEDELSDASFIPHDNAAEKITNNDVDSGSNHHEEVNIISELLLPRWNTRLGLRGWIENEYGVENTRALLAEELLFKSEREQLEVRVI